MSGARSVLYFAYGSNLSPRRIEARLGACRCLGPAILKGYRLYFHKRGADASGKCNVRDSGDGRRCVHGGLYRLRVSQARRLDEFEGRGYARQRVSVHCREGLLEAYTYVASSHWIDDALKPYDWYRELVLQGALDLGLPRVWVRKISAVGYSIDLDRGRWRRNMLLLAGTHERLPGNARPERISRQDAKNAK